GMAARLTEIGVDEVLLAATYHSVRALTPRHPRHRIVTASHAAAYYRLDKERWSGRQIRPQAATWMDRDDAFDQSVEILRAAGLRVSAWSVLVHGTSLVAQAPDAAVRNVYGDRYPWAPCAADPRVTSYVVGIAEDLACLAGISSIEIESAGWY